ncbi:MAG: helix-turn-helix transcriptional regulator [Bacteroides sp.]|nr:helix-turn-helix transcriptional regulator [Bacteroides sp.]
MDRIESILKERGLTKSAFADLMGTSRQNVNSLLKNPTREKLEAIAVALDVPMWQLFASQEEVCMEGGAGSDFTAFVRNGGELRAFDSAEALKEYVDGLIK